MAEWAVLHHVLQLFYCVILEMFLAFLIEIRAKNMHLWLSKFAFIILHAFYNRIYPRVHRKCAFDSFVFPLFLLMFVLFVHSLSLLST